MMTKQERQAAILEKRRVWRQHIQAWQESGLTQTAYCRQHDLRFHCFVYWRHKYLPKTGTGPATIVELPRSIATEVLGVSQHSRLRLAVGDQYRIEVSRDFDPIALRQLLHVLERL